MIYLENNNGTQQIFIPKNLNININKTYDEGFQDGMNYQKDKLEVLNVTENGVYTSENGFSKVNVEVANESDCPECKLGELNEELPINSQSILVHATTRGFDGFDWVTINAEKALQEKYNQGYEQGKSECGEGGSCNIQNGSFEFEDLEDGHYWQYANEYGLDGWDYIDIDASNYGRQKYEEGYNQGKSECGEGGSCNLGNLNIEWEPNWNANYFYAANEGFDGYNAVSINAERALQEKYNEGYEQGKSEGGGTSCNIGSLEEEIDVNDDGHIVRYAVDYGVDGWYYLDLDVNIYGNRKYNQGYEQGKSECGECPELTELNVTENGTYEGSFNKVNVSVNATDFSSEQVENKYNHLAFITRNISDTDTVVDKTKLLDRFGGYTENGSINFTQYKNGICLAMDSVVKRIEEGAIDWNNVDIFRSYRITEFGENMTRDKGSNLSELYIQASTFRDETVIFEDGCFATSNRLNKIVFLEPVKVIVKGNPFEGISSQGKFIVKGILSNRDKYTELINLLPSDWEVIFNPDYSE